MRIRSEQNFPGTGKTFLRHRNVADAFVVLDDGDRGFLHHGPDQAFAAGGQFGWAQIECTAFEVTAFDQVDHNLRCFGVPHEIIAQVKSVFHTEPESGSLMSNAA